VKYDEYDKYDGSGKTQDLVEGCLKERLKVVSERS
jgi:hypothetical protein